MRDEVMSSMADDTRKIIVDDDWKAQAQREKERLATEAAERAKPPAAGAVNPGFVEILNLLMMQALAALGMLQTPDGRRMEVNPEVAKLFIDLIQVLDEKTKGNLTGEEKKILDEALYSLRMRYVGVVNAAAGGPPPGVAGA